MIKKVTLLITVFLILLGNLGVSAQRLTGAWGVYPTMSADFSNIVETDSKVYLLSGGSLFSFNPDDNEIYSYTTANKLSDHDITQIYYNDDKKYLLIAYSNGNIDLLYDDGKVSNMPELKDAVLMVEHTINDVAFGFDRIFVATNFGIVVYSDTKHEVIESGLYDQKCDILFLLGENLVIKIGNALYSSPYTERHNKLDKYVHLANSWAKDIEPVDDTHYLFRHSDNTLYLATYNPSAAPGSQASLKGLGVKVTSDISKTQDGFFAQDASNAYTLEDATGSVSTTALPDASKNKQVFSRDGLKSVWASESEGAVNYDLSSGTPTVLHSAFRPQGLTVKDPVVMHWNKDGSKLFIANWCKSQYYPTAFPEKNTNMQYLNMIENGFPYDITVTGVSKDDIPNLPAKIISNQRAGGNTGIVCLPTAICSDPDDDTVMYVATAAGLFVIKDGKAIGLIDHTNAPMPLVNGTGWVTNVNVDIEGNLWLGIFSLEDDVDPQYIVLSAAKRRKLPEVSSSDWKTYRMNSGYITQFDAKTLFTRNGKYAFFWNGGWGAQWTVVDLNGTPMNFSDDKEMSHQYYTDTEGNYLTPWHTICMTEDHNGQIWIGTDGGLFVVTNPADGLNPDTRVTRPLIPRNDGTPYGDYLCEGMTIYAIAVDASNRKWIATSNSGVYLVSENGKQIIEHYTAENSDLLSNEVFSLTVDPRGNTVYVGTSKGVMSFVGSSSPAAEDYSEVYAYPNPVRPDYTGWVTITGLMNDSLIKIADSSGNVVATGRSEGGMFIWDACNTAGERVRSGVYFVFASQNADGNSSGAVTKIMVIN